MDREKRNPINTMSFEGSLQAASRSKGTASSRRKIFTASLEEECSDLDAFKPPVFPKTTEEKKFLEDSLREHFLFESISGSELSEIVGAFEKKVFPKNIEVIRQGDNGDYFYVIEDGFVGFYVDGDEMGGCSKGKSFGELSLIYSCPRAATCLTKSEVTLWQVDRKTFRMILVKEEKSRTSEVTDVLKKVPFLSNLSPLQLHKISDALVPVNFPLGKQIVNKGEPGLVFYIVMEGSMKVHDIGFGDSEYADQVLQPGDFFGERALLTGEPRAANVTALTDCTALCLNRDDFESSFGKLKSLMNEAVRKRVLLGVPNIASSQLDDKDISRLTDMFEEKTFEAQTFLEKEGEPMQSQGIYIIEEGKVRLSDSFGVITNMSKNDHFGGESIKLPKDDRSNYTIQILEKSTCSVLTKERIESVVGSVGKLGRSQSLSKKLLKLTFEDLTTVRFLGAGSFGQVTLVEYKQTKTQYALKKMSKRNILDNHQGTAVMRERNIMASIQHPLIINLVSTFQDENSLYMLLGVVKGGELFDVLYNTTHDKIYPYGVTARMSQFYAACVIEALSHLHNLYIAYRDLKPENILVDEQGYCILIDFGFAKIVMDKTYTICGTPEYLAPEILLSKGYDKAADCWSLGVLIYELLAGDTPFQAEDQMNMFRMIVKADFVFLEGRRFNNISKDLINRLLKQKPTKRLGGLVAGDKDIMNHPAFDGFDWEALVNRTMEAPWLPTPKTDDGDDEAQSEEENDDFGGFVKKREQLIFEGFGDFI